MTIRSLEVLISGLEMTLLVGSDDAGELIATCSVHWDDPKLAIFSRLFVAESWRRLGNGEAMVREVQGLALARGCAGVNCIVEGRNYGAVKPFYDALGFVLVSQCGEGDLILFKPL